MTALTMPARPDSGKTEPRPIPWRRMAGVTWRQHRIALAGVAVLLGALAVYLWTVGTSVHNDWTAVNSCPASSATCQGAAATFNSSWDLLGNIAILIQVLPALIGAFVGAPVLARELETGTFRFAWTQGFGRWRWALAKLVPLAVVLAAATYAFSLLLSWCYQPYMATGNQNVGVYGNSPLVTIFSLREVTLPAWTVATFAISALAGMLIRRVVPAIVAALAVYAGLAIAAAAFLREHYLAPIVTRNSDLPGSAWIIGQWWTKGGRVVFSGNPPLNLINQYCNFGSGGPTGKGGGGGGGGASSGNPFTQCLGPHGYTLWTSYQPASRFWPFQWIEAGWLLALSALVIAATIWLVQRRAA